MGPEGESFVLTLELDAASFERLDALRKMHFPPERNFLPAHLTLLHTVGSAQVHRLMNAHAALAPQHPIALRFAGLRPLGGGVAFAVESRDLSSLRGRVMAEMSGMFTRQDSQPFRPHVTIQNKVPVAVAARLLESLSASFEAWDGEGTGLLIWRYRGGPWELAAGLPFA